MEQPLLPASFSKYQKFVIATLAFLQFTIVLDFMVMSPLGALLMPALKMSPSQFGMAVSIYAFSAGASAILAAGFADRFDRKKLLLFFYSGFIIGTFFCALAPNYIFLLAARMVTGFFGGVISSIVLAIAADLFVLEMRGRVIGILQTAFAASQILGIPTALYFSNLWGWHAPFIMIVLLGIAASSVIWVYLKPIRGHLSSKSEFSAFSHLWQTLRNKKYILPFVTTGLLTTGGFMIMPFGSAYTVNNLGINITKLPLVYLCTGICSMIAGPLIGKASDAYGKFNVFLFGVALTILMVLIYTNLGVTPLYVVVIVNATLFVGIFSRIIPSQALMSAIPTPSNRGAFMAVSSSLQQISGGLASIVAGAIVMEGQNGRIENFNRVGFVIVFTSLISVFTMYFVQREAQRSRSVTQGKI